MRKSSLAALALAGPLLLPPAFGQSVISARSGLVNYFEGVVFLDGQPLAKKAGVFPRMKDGSTLATESGRAEVLLTPDTYLRIGENGGIRMLSNGISDTQVEVLSGSAILDSSQAPAGGFVKLVFRDSTIRFVKPGHYRVDAEPPQLRVYEGQAEVTKNGGAPGSGAQEGKPVTIKTSQLFPLDGAPVVKRFTEGADGLLDLWSDERDSLIASNMVTAQSITDPLLDSGPDVPADLAGYIGYAPMGAIPLAGANTASIPAIGMNAPGFPVGYGYGFGFPSIYPGMRAGFFPGLAVGALVPLPMNSGLYPRGLYGAAYGAGRYTPLFTPRPIYGTTGYGMPGFGTMPRPVFGTRPTGTFGTPHVGGVTGVHSGIGVHAVGHR